MGVLADLLGVGRAELVSFVGAGGKSSLLLGLGGELAAAGDRVVMTTTTKMGTEQLADWATVCVPGPEVVEALAGSHPVFVIGGIDGEKVNGVAPEYVDEMFGAQECHVLVEADGARRRSFKAPASHEPVLPAATTLLVAIAGMDAIGGHIGEVAHRPERVAALTGRALDDPVRPRDVAEVLGSPQGSLKGAPREARVVVALTKAADGVQADAAAQIEAMLASNRRIDRVVTLETLPGRSS